MNIDSELDEIHYNRLEEYIEEKERLVLEINKKKTIEKDLCSCHIRKMPSFKPPP